MVRVMRTQPNPISFEFPRKPDTSRGLPFSTPGLDLEVTEANALVLYPTAEESTVQGIMRTLNGAHQGKSLLKRRLDSFIPAVKGNSLELNSEERLDRMNQHLSLGVALEAVSEMTNAAKAKK